MRGQTNNNIHDAQKRCPIVVTENKILNPCRLTFECECDKNHNEHHRIDNVPYRIVERTQKFRKWWEFRSGRNDHYQRWLCVGHWSRHQRCSFCCFRKHAKCEVNGPFQNLKMNNRRISSRKRRKFINLEVWKQSNVTCGKSWAETLLRVLEIQYFLNSLLKENKLNCESSLVKAKIKSSKNLIEKLKAELNWTESFEKL